MKNGALENNFYISPAFRYDVGANMFSIFKKQHRKT